MGSLSRKRPCSWLTLGILSYIDLLVPRHYLATQIKGSEGTVVNV